MFSIMRWAWCSFDDATIFMALVIFRVLLTEPIRFFISFSEGILSIMSQMLVLSCNVCHNFLDDVLLSFTDFAGTESGDGVCMG